MANKNLGDISCYITTAVPLAVTISIEPLAPRAFPTTLSGGEASRVAACRALIRQPLLLLADEPTGQLDRENAQNIASLFKELNQTLGTTILMVTHSDETSAYAKRILNLTGGIIQ